MPLLGNVAVKENFAFPIYHHGEGNALIAVDNRGALLVKTHQTVHLDIQLENTIHLQPHTLGNGDRARLQ